MKTTTLPIALLDPSPRRMELIFRPDRFEELQSLVQLKPGPGDPHYQKPTPVEIDAILPEATYVIGQTDMPQSRLKSAPHLKAIINVEGNFLPNIDYDYCFARNIHVLATSPVFAHPVAEIGLGLALSLARQIPQADQAFRQGQELYGLTGSHSAVLLRDLPIGIVGFGDLGRALLELLKPFAPSHRPVAVYDPWLPDRIIRDAGAVPVGLDKLLSSCRAIFVVAAVTDANAGFLGAKELDRIPRDSLFVLLSRAGVVDFDALTKKALDGSLRVATDVWPEEPFDKAHPIRTAETAVLSAHRAGAVPSSLLEMGDRIVEDIRLINAGLPPISCKRGQAETVGRMRSRPVKKT